MAIPFHLLTALDKIQPPPLQEDKCSIYLTRTNFQDTVNIYQDTIRRRDLPADEHGRDDREPAIDEDGARGVILVGQEESDRDQEEQ